VSDFVQIRGVIVHHHLLIDDDGVHLIDGGFIGGVSAIGKVLNERGLGFEDIKSILLTHGHLDHTLNVACLQELSGCRVYAPLLDREHIAGRYRNRGWAKVVQAMEWVGRTILRYRVPKIDHWFEGGEVIDVWGGLEVIHLPGHTVGHCGFFHREGGLLFAGDLFANQFGGANAPPRILNDDHQDAQASLKLAADLPLKGVLINHGRKESPEETLIDLHEIA